MRKLWMTLAACAANCVLLGCAPVPLRPVEVGAVEVGAVVVAPQVQPAPLPAIVREVEPKPPGYFQTRKLQRMMTPMKLTE